MRIDRVFLRLREGFQGHLSSGMVVAFSDTNLTFLQMTFGFSYARAKGLCDLATRAIDCAVSGDSAVVCPHRSISQLALAITAATDL